MSVKSNRAEGRSSKRQKVSHGTPDVPANVSADSGSVDENDSVSDDDIDHSGPSALKATKPKTRLHNATGKKATVLPTGGINKSSVLALQVADLSADITPNYDRLKDEWIAVVGKVEAIIKTLPHRPQLTAVEAIKSFRKHGISIPFPQPRPTKDTNYKFEFQTPKEVIVCGALSKGLSIKNENLLDISVIIPESVLQEKDYLNNRAFHKAAFYLACIAAGIKEQAKSEFDISFSHEDGVDLLPVVILDPTQASLSKLRFRVSVGFPSQAIPVEKTLPTKNSLRQTASYDDVNPQQSTPFYNSSIRSRASSSELEIILKSARSPAFDDGSRIGQLWLRQRGFSSSISAGGFGFWEWSIMCALLLRGGGHRGHPLFSKQYSSLQFFKAMLQVLAGRDLRDPLIVSDEKLEIPRSDAPVLFDGNTGVNILYKMSPWSYQSLRHNAQISLVAVNAKNQDNFESVFMLRIAEPLLQYDEIFSLRLSSNEFRTTSNQVQYLHELHSVLSRGLGDRVTLVDFKLPESRSWALKRDSSFDGDFELEIGLLTIPENVTRLVDRGPAADEQEEAAEFQKFWGERAERRRFKDGSITESLVWASGSPVTLQILRHLLLHHFKLLPSSVMLKSRDLETGVLGESRAVGAKDAFRVINNSYQSLTSTLHGLEGLPLPIRSISPADAALRSSTVAHPLLPSTTKPIDIIIQFDSSTRWPDSLPAIQHTKIAFLLKLSELLSSSTDTDLTTRVGLENTDSATTGHSNTSFLDIIYPPPAPGLSPICFRVRIHHDRELHLLQTALADKSQHGSVRDSLTAALAAYKRQFLAAPIHTTTIRNLCTRFPPLSSTIRLLKKWVSSHLLLHHISEEILETIAAHVFLHPAPWSVPGSSTTAFLRCLHLISRWDFALSPLVIDLSLSQDMAAEQTDEITTRFQAWRKLDPGLNSVVWFVGTNLDNTGTVWTQGGRPERVVAARVRALATAAVSLVKSSGTKLSDEEWSGLFVSPLTDFDFRIYLKASVLKEYRKPRSKGPGKEVVEFKNLQLNRSLDIDSIGYDPVALFLDDLRNAFGAAALFFHDSHGGDVIAGLWKPAVLGEKEWRVRLGWSSVPVANEGEGENGPCVFNKEGVLAEIAALGEGIVKEVKMKD